MDLASSLKFIKEKYDKSYSLTTAHYLSAINKLELKTRSLIGIVEAEGIPLISDQFVDLTLEEINRVAGDDFDSFSNFGEYRDGVVAFMEPGRYLEFSAKTGQLLHDLPTQRPDFNAEYERKSVSFVSYPFEEEETDTEIRVLRQGIGNRILRREADKVVAYSSQDYLMSNGLLYKIEERFIDAKIIECVNQPYKRLLISRCDIPSRMFMFRDEWYYIMLNNIEHMGSGKTTNADVGSRNGSITVVNDLLFIVDYDIVVYRMS